MFQEYSFYDLFKNPYKKDLEEARRREELGRKIIADQRKKIYELEEKGKEMTEKIKTINKVIMDNKWINVKDELPKLGKNVLVLTKNKKFIVTHRYQPKDKYGNILGSPEWKGSRAFGDSIIAWMPIPPIDEFFHEKV